MGFSGKALEDLAAEMQDGCQLWKLADPMFPPMKGLFHGHWARAHLERSLGDVCFEDLERQLLVVTLDIDTKERLARRRGKIRKRGAASGKASPRPQTISTSRCTSGLKAKHLIVMARTPLPDKLKAITAFIVEVAWRGVEIVTRCRFMGLKALYDGVIRFDEV